MRALRLLKVSKSPLIASAASGISIEAHGLMVMACTTFRCFGWLPAASSLTKSRSASLDELSVWAFYTASVLILEAYTGRSPGLRHIVGPQGQAKTSWKQNFISRFRLFAILIQKQEVTMVYQTPDFPSDLELCFPASRIRESCHRP